MTQQETLYHAYLLAAMILRQNTEDGLVTVILESMERFTPEEREATRAEFPSITESLLSLANHYRRRGLRCQNT